MSYDILFAGELAPGAQSGQVRAKLQKLFRLSDETMARLFSGQPLALKRGLDQAQAERLRQVFLTAGAIARLVEQPALSSSTAATAPPLSGDHWRLAPVADDEPMEPAPAYPSPAVDISRLHLVTDQDWSLADCDQPPVPAPVPDTSHLRILEQEQS